MNDNETPLPLSQYIEKLQILNTTLKQKVHRRKRSIFLRDVLIARDNLDNYLKYNPGDADTYLLEIKQADDDLYELGRETLRQEWINLAAWREIKKPTHQIQESYNQVLPWWWHLDTVSYNQSARIDDNRIWSVIFGFITPCIILFISLSLIVQTTRLIATFVLTVFAEVEISELGFDLFTLGAIVSQVIFSERISVRFAQQFTEGINHILKAYPWRGRSVFVLFLPISRFLVGSIIFIMVVFALKQLIIPQLANILESQAQSIEELELASMLQVDANDYAVSLSLIGYNYEQTNDLELAKQKYEQALATDPTVIITRYRLAELYTDLGDIDRAIRLLDDGLQQLSNFLIEKTGLPLNSLQQAKQVQFLMLVSRARAFMTKQAPLAAEIDLIAAERLVTDNPELFILDKENKAPGAIDIVPMYYYRANNYHTLFDQTSIADYAAGATVAWKQVELLADVENGKQRLWLIEANKRLTP